MSRRSAPAPRPQASQAVRARTIDSGTAYDYRSSHDSAGHTPAQSRVWGNQDTDSDILSALGDLSIRPLEATTQAGNRDSWIPWDPETLQPLPDRKSSQDRYRSPPEADPSLAPSTSSSVECRISGHSATRLPSQTTVDTYHASETFAPRGHSSYPRIPNSANLFNSEEGSGSRGTGSDARSSGSPLPRRSQTSDVARAPHSPHSGNSVLGGRMHTSPKSIHAPLPGTSHSRQVYPRTRNTHPPPQRSTLGIEPTNRASTASYYDVPGRDNLPGAHKTSDMYHSGTLIPGGLPLKAERFDRSTCIFKPGDHVLICMSAANDNWRTAQVKTVRYVDRSGTTVASPKNLQEFDGIQKVKVRWKDNAGCELWKECSTDEGNITMDPAF